jgi:hypothetical protein
MVDHGHTDLASVLELDAEAERLHRTGVFQKLPLPRRGMPPAPLRTGEPL